MTDRPDIVTRICCRKPCGEEAVTLTAEREWLCFDHLQDWLMAQDLFEADTDCDGRRRRVMRHARAL